MKILLLNQCWFATELRARGHEVISAGIFRPDLDVSFSAAELELDELLWKLPTGFVPERIVYFDDSGVPWLTGLEASSIRKVFYSIDTHHHHGWHELFATLFDGVLVAQKKFVELFSPPRWWFPPWAPLSIGPSDTRPIDVCFRGNLDPKLHPRRAAFFERLGRLVPGNFAGGDYTEAYPRSKIVVNQAVNEDLNFRVFEAMMCGALLVTPSTATGLLDLFVSGEELLVYPDDDASAAAALVTEMLADDARRERIAAAGRRKVLAAHTKEVRAAELESILESLTERKKPLLHFSASQSYLFSYLVSEISGIGQRRVLLFSACSNIVRALSREEGLVEERTVSFVLQLTSKLHELGEHVRERAVFEALANRFPESIVAKLGLIETLLLSGERHLAHELAAKIAPDATQLLGEVPRLMDETRAEMKAGLPKPE